MADDIYDDQEQQQRPRPVMLPGLPGSPAATIAAAMPGQIPSVAPAPTYNPVSPPQPGPATAALFASHPPELHGWRNVLDVAGRILAPRIEAAIPGTPGNYYGVQLPRMERAAGLEQAAFGTPFQQREFAEKEEDRRAQMEETEAQREQTNELRRQTLQATEAQRLEANRMREEGLTNAKNQAQEANRMREEGLQNAQAQRQESNAIRREAMENQQQNRAEMEAWRKETESNRTAEQSAHMAERFDDKYQQPFLKSVARANTLKAALSQPGPIGNIDNSIMMELIENTRPDKGFRMSEPILKREFGGTDWADKAERFFGGITSGAQLGPDQRRVALALVDSMLENQRQNLIETAKRRKISPDYVDQRILNPVSGAGAPTAAGAPVRMRAPNGQVKEVPPDQVEHYKSLGASVVR